MAWSATDESREECRDACVSRIRRTPNCGFVPFRDGAKCAVLCPVHFLSGSFPQFISEYRHFVSVTSPDGRCFECRATYAVTFFMCA